MQEMLGVLIGGGIAILASLAVPVFDKLQRKGLIKAVVVGELETIRDKAERFGAGAIDKNELRVSTPMLTSLAELLGYLQKEQFLAYRKAVVAFAELKASTREDRVTDVLEACRFANSKLC